MDAEAELDDFLGEDEDQELEDAEEDLGNLMDEGGEGEEEQGGGEGGGRDAEVHPEGQVPDTEAREV